MTFLAEVTKHIQGKTFPASSRHIKGFWNVSFCTAPLLDSQSPPFIDRAILIESIGIGYCTVPPGELVLPPESFIGLDVMEIDYPTLSLQIACLDSVLAGSDVNWKREVSLRGSTAEKSQQRAVVIQGEMQLIISKTRMQRPKVLLVGAVPSLLHVLTRLNCDVHATDFDPNFIGQKISGVEVLSGSNTNSILPDMNIALVTGMTIATNTYDSISSIAKENDVKIVVYSQTGSNLSRFFLQTCAETVVSESFPNYLFPGKSSIKVFRR